jgi:lactoylglutathione lyase
MRRPDGRGIMRSQDEGGTKMTTLSGDETLFNHVGICVTDLERSRKFYEEVLQFRYWWEIVPDDALTSQVLQIPQPLGLKAVYMVRGDFVLELLHVSQAEVLPFRRRVFNEPGLTHISFALGDMEAVLAKVEPNGGQIIEETNATSVVMIRDPDGQLLELNTTAWLQRLPPRPR